MTRITSRIVSGCAALCLTATAAFGQVTAINSDVVHQRFFGDIPTAGITVVNNYPTVVSFTETNVSAPTGFANMDLWRFSTDATNDYDFQNDDFFNATMNVTLTASATSPRKEAGFRLTTQFGGEGQFLVNTDAHEIVAFGGPFPFYAFPATYNSGQTITLGIRYFLDGNTGMRSIAYSANGVESPVMALTNVEQGLHIGTTNLGGYFQIPNDPNNATNSGSAVFGNISIVVPEPMSLGMIGLGGLTLLARRRK